MFPGIDGFHWSSGHIVFLSVFFGILAVVGATVSLAVRRFVRDVRRNREPSIRWHADFEDLPAAGRACRHAMTGVAPGRICENGFDCRHCAEHPRLAGQEQPLPMETYGLEFPENRFYHRGHTWVEPQPDGTLRVGLDDLAARLMGDFKLEELPRVGSHLEPNDVAWRMSSSKAEARVLCPVEGEVVATGGREKGWYLSLRPSAPGPDLRHLLHGSEVGAWLRRELERLQMSLSSALADGGVPAANLPKAQPRADWDRIYGAFFLAP